MEDSRSKTTYLTRDFWSVELSFQVCVVTHVSFLPILFMWGIVGKIEELFNILVSLNMNKFILKMNENCLIMGIGKIKFCKRMLACSPSPTLRQCQGRGWDSGFMEPQPVVRCLWSGLGKFGLTWAFNPVGWSSKRA